MALLEFYRRSENLFSTVNSVTIKVSKSILEPRSLLFSWGQVLLQFAVGKYIS